MLQHPILIQQVASAVQGVFLFLAQSLEMVTIRERPVQFDPKICGNWTEWQKFAFVVYIKLKFGPCKMFK